ncbi:MAG: glycosyltransferase family 4 protein [Staphylococcus epidermidis]|nr:glycosyltransferase family 4 protein [Staphylococcus epidermidis]
MKIMYVNTLGVWGGVATYLRPLIKEQVKLGNDVYLVVGNEGELTKDIENNFPEVNIIILETMERDVNVFGIFKSIFKFRKIIKKISPDIIHLNCIMAGLIGRIGSLFLKPKIIYNAHGWAFEPGTSKKYKWPAIIIEKTLAYFTDSIICVSDYEEKIAQKYHIFKNNKQSIVIKNASSDWGLSEVKTSDDTFVITMAARFWKQKNQLLLIKSLRKMLADYKINKRVILYLLGDGPTMKECMDFVKEYGLQKNGVFEGRVSNVNDYYRKSDVVALITNYDAIAISLIEALSMGKPLIASNVSGVPENFGSPINGYCIPNNIDVISESLYKILTDDSLRHEMSINSRHLYEQNFKMIDNIKKHQRLYEDLKNR